MRLLDRIPNKRESLARLLGAAGVARLLESASRRAPSLVVLTYHRIAEPGIRSDPYYDPVISATPASFADHLSLLRRRFRPVSLEQAQDPEVGRATVSRTGRLPVLVTFDDGYRDNFDAALPILRRFEIPAVFFIPTRFLEQPELPWWDHVAFVLKRTRAEHCSLRRSPEDAEPVTLRLGREPDDRARIAAIRQVIDLVLADAIPDRPWFLDQLAAQADVPVDSHALGADLFMSWEQLRALVASGMAIGSHGHAHVALGTLDPDAQRRDLGESRRILEEGLGRPVVAVAYPYGWPGTFTAETTRIAAEVGYRLGFSSLEGVNRPGSTGFDPLCLRRLNVGSGDTGPLLRARVALHGVLGRSFL